MVFISYWPEQLQGFSQGDLEEIREKINVSSIPKWKKLVILPLAFILQYLALKNILILSWTFCPLGIGQALEKKHMLIGCTFSH